MNNIDNLFKEELGGYTEAPPPAVWDALEKRLQDENKRRVYPYRWMWYFGIVSFIVLLGSSIAWMMANNANKQRMTASIANNTTEQPKNTVVAAVNGKPESTATNNAKTDAQTRKGSYINNSKNNNTKNDNHRRETTLVKKSRARHHENHRVAPVKKETRDDLYADTDDDQYTVGGTNAPHKNYETAENDGTGAVYTTQARSQHNIRVAEMEPTQTVHDNNYGSYTAVTASRATEVANSHYDIDLSDNNNNEAVTSKSHKTSGARSRKNTVANTSVANRNIARNTKRRSESSKNVVAVVTKSPKTQNDKAAKTAMPNATNTPAALAVVQTGKQRKHTAVSAPQKTVASSTNTQIGTPAAATSTKLAEEKTTGAVVASNRKQAASTPDKKASSDNVVTSNKTSTTKTTPAQDVYGKPVASATAVPIHKARNHKAAPSAEVNHEQKEVAVNETPAVAVKPAVTGKTALVEKAAAKSKASKLVINQYGAGSSTASTASKHDSKTVTTQTTAKQNKPADKPAPVVAVGKTNKQKEQSEKKATSAKKAEKGKNPAITENNQMVKKDNVRPKTTPAEKVTRQNKKEAASDKAVAKNDSKPTKRETGRKQNTNKTVAPAPVVPPVNIYSSSLSKRSLEQETVVVDNLKVNNFAAQQSLADASDAYYDLVPSTFKSDAGKTEHAAPGAATGNGSDSASRHSKFARKFEYGVKGGLETGFNARAANKVVVSPYLQYDLSEKFSLLTQPSMKVSHLSNISVGNSHNCYDTTGTYTVTGSGAVYFIAYAGGSAVSIENTLTKYKYTYDSIVKSYSVGGTYVEIEMPLLLQYKIGNGLSVYGGANSLFSKAGIKENTNHYTGNFNTITLVPVNSTPTLPVTANLRLPGTPIKQYRSPYPAQGDLFRLGYMLGFSYEYKKRWLFDALVQQAMVKPNYEAGVNTNAPLAMPYFRLTLGYKLSK